MWLRLKNRLHRELEAPPPAELFARVRTPGREVAAGEGATAAATPAARIVAAELDLERLADHNVALGGRWALVYPKLGSHEGAKLGSVVAGLQI